MDEVVLGVSWPRGLPYHAGMLREDALDELLAPAARKMSKTTLRRPRSSIPCGFCTSTSEEEKFSVHVFGENFFTEKRIAAVANLITCLPDMRMTERRMKKAAPRFPPAYH